MLFGFIFLISKLFICLGTFGLSDKLDSWRHRCGRQHSEIYAQ